MKGISVIICCYNSAKRLPETLRHLAQQKVSVDLDWEIIVVNNNSTDTTEKDAISLWQSFGNDTSLIVVNEPQPGLSHARDKGMSVAQYDLFLWCDDDNWLCDTYVQTAFNIMEQQPDIGALGGWCEAAFEAEKPTWFNTYSWYFAVSKQGRQSGDITNKKGCVYGAGMVLRKSHNLELKALGFKQLLNDRKGKSLSSGGDTEYCYAIRLLGYKIWYDDRLYFKHFMIAERPNFRYISRLKKALVNSNFILWPYQDLLNNKRRTKIDFLKTAFKGIPVNHAKQLLKLIIGNFDKKENAKEYFRYFKLLLFSYDVYEENWKLIQEWHSKIDKKHI